MMMGALLDHPTRCAIRSGIKNGTVGVTVHMPVCQVILILASLGLELGWECEGPIVGWGGCHWCHVPSVPPGWFKADAG